MGRAKRQTNRPTKQGWPIGADIVVAVIHDEDVDSAFHRDVSRLIFQDGHGGPGRILDYIDMDSGPRLTHARNQMVGRFLDNHVPHGAEWLFWLDADMTFQPQWIYDLVDLADPLTRPIYAGVAWMQGRDDRAASPNIFVPYGDGGVTNIARLPEGERGPLDCLATGSACVAVHKQVYLDVFKAWHERTCRPWYSEVEMPTPKGNYAVGEDVTFCIRAAELGHQTWVDTRYEFGHRKRRDDWHLWEAGT